MPQVHNKSLSYDTTSAFGKNSRYIASLRLTENSLRQVHVVNRLENRLAKKKLDFYEKETNLHVIKHDRVKKRLIDNLNKRLAFKLVLRNHSISQAKDYKKGMKEKFTLESLHNEVRQMMQFMKPDRIRQRKARSLVHEQQNIYENMIFQNAQKFNKLFPEKKTWMSRRQLELLELKKQEEAKQPTPIPTLERKARQSLALLRRRVISLDDSKPNSPLKVPKTPALTPIKTPSISKPPSSNSRMTNRRQEISMSMMKKQKSFFEGREMTMPLKEDNVESVAVKMQALSVRNNGEQSRSSRNSNVSRIENISSSKVVKQKGESFLPAIGKSPVTTESNISNLITQTESVVKLPVLKMSKSIKVQ